MALGDYAKAEETFREARRLTRSASMQAVIDRRLETARARREALDRYRKARSAGLVPESTP